MYPLYGSQFFEKSINFFIEYIYIYVKKFTSVKNFILFFYIALPSVIELKKKKG